MESYSGVRDPVQQRAHPNHLNFFASIQDVIFMKYWIGDLLADDRMVDTTKKGLNPHLPEATDLFIDEAATVFSAEFGELEDWKSFTTVESTCQIAHRMSSRILLGRKLCRNPAFLEASYAYFQGHGITAGVFFLLPFNFLRDLLQYPLTYVQKRRQKRIMNIVSNAFAERMEEMKNNNDRKPETDAIEWTINLLPDRPAREQGSPPLWRLSHQLIHLLGASYTPTGFAVTQMIWKVLAYPEYLEPLRKEADEAVAQFGLSSKIVNALPLQDSFIRECNRLHPGNTLGTQRTVIGEPFQFHDGMTLPKGTRIAFPVSASQRDPELFTDPEEFDGYRYLKLSLAGARTEEGVNIWAASHAHETNQIFGFGTHVCPGRFFAVRVIKIMFTKLITEYDMRWDFKGPGTPKSMHLEGSVFPNMSQKIQLRKRVR